MCLPEMLKSFDGKNDPEEQRHQEDKDHSMGSGYREKEDF